MATNIKTVHNNDGTTDDFYAYTGPSVTTIPRPAKHAGPRKAKPSTPGYQPRHRK